MHIWNWASHLSTYSLNSLSSQNSYLLIFLYEKGNWHMVLVNAINVFTGFRILCIPWKHQNILHKSEHIHCNIYKKEFLFLKEGNSKKKKGGGRKKKNRKTKQTHHHQSNIQLDQYWNRQQKFNSSLWRNFLFVQ